MIFAKQTRREFFWPLYRLTAADYSNGDYYHYTLRQAQGGAYDAVGNRLTQSSMVSGLSSTVDYIYDDANRLSSVNGVTYTWDNNGNLLNDGVNAYTYNAANRMISFNGGGINATYTYNGLGDRLQQTVNGNTTTYTLDINTSLSEVLSDGQTTYLYGLDNVAQIGTEGTQYFLGDALNSIRQLANASAQITLAQSYDPFGNTVSHVGSGQSIYGYTSEQVDPSGLVYLRARYYAPSVGRFLTRDTWEGDIKSPITYNKWEYASSNPVVYTDPSGLCSGNPNDINNPDKACWNMLLHLETLYSNIDILDQGQWTYNELLAIANALAGHVFAGDTLSANLISFYRKDFGGIGIGGATLPLGNGKYSLTMYDFAYYMLPDMNDKSNIASISNFEGVLIHELAHVAIEQNPSILTSYQTEQSKHSSGSLIAGLYNWQNCQGVCQDKERIAVSAAVWRLKPGAFKNLFFTDWRGAWIQTLYSPNLIVNMCYGPYQK